ncbi:MAG: hypothetical protein AAGD96_13080 [Chloroflexota bacterium]
MRTRRTLTLINWGVAAALMLLFLNWHGAFEGPLTSEEIDTYMARIEARDGEVEFNDSESSRDIRAFLEADDGKPFVMVNVLQLRDAPLIVDGESYGETAQEASDTYGTFVAQYLFRRGSYPMYSGTAAYDSVTSWGIENAEEWSSAGLMRYRSRRTMIEMVTDPEFQQYHGYKVAAIEKTFAYPTTVDIHLIDLGWFVGLLLLSLALAFQLLIVLKVKPQVEGEQ